MRMLRMLAVVVTAAVLAAGPAAAQSADPPPYGAPIGYDQAKKAMAAAEAEAQKNNWNVAIAILDSGGHLMMFTRFDGVQHASVRLADGKARTALEYRRPSKALEAAVAGGGAGLRLLSVPGTMALEGGVTIVADGRIVGAIGVSGVMSAQDAQIAQAGADAVK